MPRRCWGWIWLAVLAIHGGVTSPGVVAEGRDQLPAPSQGASDMLLQIRAYADGRVAPGTLTRAHDVARGILDSAGLGTEWRLCVTPEACPPAEGHVSEVVVILSSHARPDGHVDCGRAARGESDSEGTVLVSVPCVRDVVMRLARPSRNRAHPLLAAARHEDLVGAVIAHELGHVLGMGHAPTGLMRAQLGADELIALGSGLLGFSESEGAILRTHATLARRE
ncbi:hypothetical protein LuPra_02361 [Luteitalea pratensis]|uniref:Matrixin n=1 Tax=Luteitalea pratensis TaxID=1855912 RepID=A0A143PM38_LUTPR|nr:hypothetical protein [Luteitalea pratensis]AMY09148.1 hypothetical protein LuPra_02361 [Luteitalea pratensis]